MKTFLALFLSVGAATMILVAVAAGAGLDSRIRSVKNGTVEFRYETWPDVWGNSDGSLNRGGLENGHYISNGNWGRKGDWYQGPMIVRLTMAGGEPVKLKARIDDGARVDGDIDDLGTVSPQEAADWLMRLAATGRKSVAEDALVPALFARDAVVVPGLFAVARDRNRPSDLRQSALFWLGQEAGDQAAAELGRVAADEDEDAEVRESAVFALSRRPADESIPLLAKLARTSPHPDVRRSAYFWLAQSDDPRVLELFEEVLGSN
jgi:hypothetical protein